MTHDFKSDGGRAATDSAAQTGQQIQAGDFPRRAAAAVPPPMLPPLALDSAGTRRVPVKGAVSFVRDEVTPRGRFINRHHFDLAAQRYGAGGVSGVLAAAELLRMVRANFGGANHHVTMAMTRDVLISAAKAADLSGMEPSRAGAAFDFVRFMAELVLAAATHPNIEPFIAETLERAQHDATRWDRFLAERRATFVERMRAARAAKRHPRAPLPPAKVQAYADTNGVPPGESAQQRSQP